MSTRTVITEVRPVPDNPTRNWVVADESAIVTCRCCQPPMVLIPRAGQGDDLRYALCLRTGRMHLIEGAESRLVAQSNPRDGEGGGRPELAPGVRVDLSRDTYALSKP